MNTITLRVKDTNAKKLLKQLEALKLVEVINETTIKWTPIKVRQAKGLLKAMDEVQQHEKGQIKLKSAKAFINAL